MVLEINEEIYLYTFAGEDNFGSEKANRGKERTTYLFDLDTFTVCESGTDEARAAERTIAFPSLTRAQAQREYIKALDNSILIIFSEILTVRNIGIHFGSILMMEQISSMLSIYLKTVYAYRK